MRLFIPPLGTKLVLTKDWTFDLWSEYRNDTLFDVLGIEKPPRPTWQWVANPETGKHEYQKSPGGYVSVTLPKGTELVVDRIYIHDSVTFRMPGHSTERKTAKHTIRAWLGERYSEPKEVEYTIPKKPVRFWAKLSDVNNMEVW